MEEKKAIVFTAYKRTDGFEVSLTFRGDTGTEVLGLLDKAIEAIKEKGGTPVAKGFNKPQIEKKLAGFCTKHNQQMYLNKNGKPYHMDRSRAEGDQFCNGRGFPSENEGQSSEIIGKRINEDF